MHAEAFIQDLATIMLVAGVVTLLFHRLKLPVVLGYILAGIIIGPHTPPFSLIHDQNTIHTLAELGLMFLLFSLGLEFNLKKLGKVGVSALAAGFIEITLMMFVGYEIGQYFGWKPMDALFLGAMTAISSTTIIVKAFDELNLKHHRFAQLIFGILLVEDVIAIAIIALLSGVATSGSLSAVDVLTTLGKLVLFMVVSLLVGLLTIPRLLNYVDKYRSQEMLLVTTLGLLFGFCLLVIKLKYSMALGAFVIGAIIAESRQVKKIEKLIEPVRDMFSAIFFVAIGLLFNPSVLTEYTVPILVITLAVIIGKIISCSIGAFIAGQDGKTSMRVGMGLAQIGEFSFISASLGISLKVTSDFLYPIAVAVASVTALTTPFLMRSADGVSTQVAKAIPSGIAEVANTYTKWLQSIQPQGDKAMLAKIIRRIVIHALINFAVVIAIFLASAYFVDVVEQHLSFLVFHEGLEKTVVWSSALLVSLPFLIAAYRKLKALSMLLAEMSAGEYTVQTRKVISEVIPIVAILLMLFLVSALSASILPPANLLFAVLGLFALLVPLLWTKFVKLHSRLQIALIETLEEEEGQGH